MRGLIREFLFQNKMKKGKRNRGRKFFKRKTTVVAFGVLMIVSITALLSSLIANEKPLYVKYKGENLYPALSLKGFADVGDERIVYATADWRNMKKENVIWCPVAFSPGRSDLPGGNYQPPLEKKVGADTRPMHLLGTTRTGADVLSGLIHGAKVSLTVGIFSMIIAGSIGILLGAAAGFFGDYRISVSRVGLISGLLLGLPLSWFYGIHLNPATSVLGSTMFALIISAACIFISARLGSFIAKLFGWEKNSFLHIDQFISRSIEIFNSIPRLVLIITLSAIARPSVMSLVLIIGFTSWTEIARLVRAEMLKAREMEFMQSAEASGIKITRQIFRHALPNILGPALTAITLGAAAAILIESGLSFLGVGVPADVVTWGSLLNEGRQNFSAWWLIVFPGIAIFITVASLNLLGDALNEMLDRK
jgi:peptide/nickel transport system permease protein